MRGPARILKILAFVVVAVAVFGFFVMHLWNWLMPAVFGLHAISYAQAIGLLILSKILFWSGFRGRPGGPGPWRRKMAERWERMTPEEREKFRSCMQGGCGRPMPTPAEDVKS